MQTSGLQWHILATRFHSEQYIRRVILLYQFPILTRSAKLFNRKRKTIQKLIMHCLMSAISFLDLHFQLLGIKLLTTRSHCSSLFELKIYVLDLVYAATAWGFFLLFLFLFFVSPVFLKYTAWVTVEILVFNSLMTLSAHTMDFI